MTHYTSPIVLSLAGAQLCEFLPQLFIFQLQAAHALFSRMHRIADLFRRITWRDVLRAVPVVRFHMYHEYPFDDCLVSGHTNTLHPVSRLLAFEDLDAAEHLKPGLPRIVDHDESNTIVAKQIACADKLLVSAKVCERQRAVVDHFQKSLWAAAMLNVRPSRCSYRCPVEGVAPSEKFRFEGSEALWRAGFLHALILPTAAVALLQLFHEGREDKRAKAHRVSFD